MLVAAFTAAAVACSTPDILDGPMHDTARDYLKTIAAGGPYETFHGECGGRPGEDPRKLLGGEGPGFTVKLTGSSQGGDSATVNTAITGQDGSPSPYTVDLRRENGAWRVCGVGTGSVELDAG